MTPGQGWNLSGRKMGRAVSTPSFSTNAAKKHWQKRALAVCASYYMALPPERKPRVSRAETRAKTEAHCLLVGASAKNTYPVLVCLLQS